MQNALRGPRDLSEVLREDSPRDHGQELPTLLLLVHRWRAEEALRGPHVAAKQLFNRIDRETHYAETEDERGLLRPAGPELWSDLGIDPKLRANALLSVRRYVGAGLTRRQLGDPDPYAEFRSEDPRFVDKLEALSTIFLAAFRASYSRGAVLDVEGIGLAFERFAAGELALIPTRPANPTPAESEALDLLRGACQPNSATYFLFAELAYLGWKHVERHADLWRRLLPALVFSQRTFYAIYSREPGRPEVWRAQRFGKDQVLARPIELTPEERRPLRELRAQRTDFLRRCESDDWLLATWRNHCLRFVASPVGVYR